MVKESYPIKVYKNYIERTTGTAIIDDEINAMAGQGKITDSDDKSKIGTPYPSYILFLKGGAIIEVDADAIKELVRV